MPVGFRAGACINAQGCTIDTHLAASLCSCLSASISFCKNIRQRYALHHAKHSWYFFPASTSKFWQGIASFTVHINVEPLTFTVLSDMMAKLPADTILDARHLVLEPLFSSVLVISEIFSAARLWLKLKAFACYIHGQFSFSACLASAWAFKFLACSQ